MAKQFSIKQGDKEIKMLFGTTGFFFHVKDATGMDPFIWMNRFIAEASPEKEGQDTRYSNLEDLCAIVYAGVNTYNDVYDLPAIDIGKARRLVSGFSLQENQDVFNTSFLSFSTGEAEAPINGADLQEKLNPGTNLEQKPTE